MDLDALAFFGTEVVASAAGIVAAAINRLRKVAAGTFALAGGLVPWLVPATLHGWIPSSGLLSVIGPIGSDPLLHSWIPSADLLLRLGQFGSGPLFLVAFFLYVLGERTPRRGFAAGASLVGMFAGIGVSAFVSRAIARME